MADDKSPGSPGRTGTTGRGVGFVGLPATTNNEIQNLWRHIGTVQTMMDAKVDALQSKVDGQIATVMAEFRTAEAKRASDFELVQRDFGDLKKNLPTKEDISRGTRNWALLIGGFVVALLSLLWMFFDTGTSVTGAVAERIIKSEEAQQRQEKQFGEIQATLNKLSEDRKHADAQRGPREGQARPVH